MYELLSDHIYVHDMGPWYQVSEKRVSATLELELQTAVCWHMGAGNHPGPSATAASALKHGASAPASALILNEHRGKISRDLETRKDG